MKPLAFLLALFACPVAAQMSVGDTVAGITMPVILNPCTVSGCAPAASEKRTVPVPTRYTPTDDDVRIANAAFLAEARAANPPAADDIAKAQAGFDYRASYRGLIAGTGLVDNDAADAFTAYILTGWTIANDRPSLPAPALFTAARAHFAAKLASNPQLPRKLAQAAELWKVRTVWLAAGREGARQRSQRDRYADAVVATFRRTAGLDLRTLVLTAAGLRHR